MIIRPAQATDAAALTDLLNEIIAIGGTTAHEVPYTPAKFLHSYITGPAVVCCHVADVGGTLLGFQAVDINANLPAGWGDIGTFVQPGLQKSGTGSALFAATRAACAAKGLTTINATIRADNAPGLAYYHRAGFVDYTQDPAFTLKDGTCVGRISKRCDLTQ